MASAALIPMSGTAQTVDKFPGFPSLREATAKGPVKAPINQERKKGLKVFGFTQIDYNKYRNFCNWYENEYMLDKLNPIFTPEEEQLSRDLWMVNAGAYNADDGYYYAYKVKYYTIGITYSYQWLRVNPADGTWEVVCELENGAHDNTPLYDLAYSVYDREMWGLVQNVDGQVKSRIGLVDLETSEVSDLTQLNEYYFAISFDYDGNLYGIRWKYDAQDNINGTVLDTFDKNFNITNSRDILVDGQPFKSYYQHGLDFDYTTGDLIWAATDLDGNQKMVRINPDNGETKNFGAVGFNEIFLGLHVPYTVAESREAPAVITNPGFTVDKDGNNNVTLNWTNPSTTWNRKPLTDLQSVVIYRDAHSGSPVGTVDAAGMEGKTMSWTDSNTTPGVHKYYIMGKNGKGEGVETYVEAFVGHDTPGPVQNLTVSATDRGRKVVLEWEAPVTGDSEGWFDKNSLTYDIVRNPGNVTVAENLNDTYFKDSSLGEAQYFTYTVTPRTADGVGTPVESEGILAGNSLKIPFSADFTRETEANRFSSVDLGGTGATFSYTKNNKTREGCLGYSFNTGATNATLVTPALNLTEGKTYRVTYTFDINRSGYSLDEIFHHFRLLGGVAPSAEMLTQQIYDNAHFRTTRSDENCEVSAYFTSPVTGDYYVAFQMLSNLEVTGAICVNTFEIIESPENDLEVTDIYAPKSVSSSHENYFNVTVYNNGMQPQSNYSVEVGIVSLDNTFHTIAATSDVPTINAHESAVVRVKGTAAKYSGTQDVAARVVLEGDGFDGNDHSALKEVNVEPGVAFNYHVGDKASTWESTALPAYYYESKTGSQTIYTVEMLGLEKPENEIAGLAWEYFAEAEANPEVTIYLGKTDKDTYSDTNLINNGAVKVFEGVVPQVVCDKDNQEWLIVRFPEGSYFPISNTENLVVTFIANETANNGTFPLHFSVFNSPNADLNSSDGLYHSVEIRDIRNNFSFADGGKYNDNELPTLNVALNAAAVGVEGVSEAAGFSIRYIGGNLCISGDPTLIKVFSLDGRNIASIDPQGRSNVALQLSRGAYIVAAYAEDGSSKVIKIIK